MTINQTQAILSYLADLAPRGRRTPDVFNRRSEFVSFGGRPHLIRVRWNTEESPPDLFRKTADLRRLAAIDSLNPSEDLLRLGWLFVVGKLEVDGKPTRYCLPLLSAPVRLRDSGLNYRLVLEGDPEMPSDFFDWDARLELEEGPDPFGGGSDTDSDEIVKRLPKLSAWVREALEKGGLPPAPLRGGHLNPADLRDQDGLSVVATTALYTKRDVYAPDVAGVLRTWSHQAVGPTALGLLYGQEPDTTAIEQSEVRSPLPLNRSQREALDRLNTEAVTVVSGPPGTGKSHLVAAAAIDQVSRGNSVLIATQSDHATSVIADLLQRHPGPRFVRFGNRRARETVAAELGDGLAQPLSSDEHRKVEVAADQAREKVSRIRRSIETLLQRELDFTTGLRAREINLLAAAHTPGVLDEGFDLDRAERLLDRARSGFPVFRSFVKGRALKHLRGLVGGDGATTLADIDAGLDAARAERAISRGLAGGGLTLGPAWDELEAAETEYRRAIGGVVEAERRSRENSRRRSTRAVASLASALRAGRARRRQILRDLNADEFLDVLPLWIGTLQEIDDTLPVIPGSFDLVIFDEASQIDQIRAAPALARGKRTMIVGDPRQLRHVSFVSDDAMDTADRSKDFGPNLSRVLDVRRNSLFDVGAAATHITWLDEHFRSVPHIIKFSDRHFYGGNLRLMTQHPRNETQDAIHTIRVSGTRNGKGVNAVEVDAVINQVQQYAAAGVTSIGIVSPFRAQADAVEEAVLAHFGPEDVERLGLLAGTVHAFQGNERDVVIATMAIDNDTSGGSLNFIQNPNLFNVLVTRAKREMVVVTSVDEDSLPAGLLADYLRHAEHAPLGANGGESNDSWTSEVLREVRAFGHPATPSYPVAGWKVDISVGERDEAIGVETQINEGGPAAHIERHLALRRAGWTMADAFQSRWFTDPSGAAEMLSKQMIRRRSAG